MPIFFLLALSALADPPAPPEGCFDSVLIDRTGIGDAPTCWFVDGNGLYAAPEVTAGDLRVRELENGQVRADCVAQLDNDHGHAVRWVSSNSCATDPDVMCQIGLPDESNVSTLRWRILVSPGGLATLTCIFTP